MTSSLKLYCNIQKEDDNMTMTDRVEYQRVLEENTQLKQQIISLKEIIDVLQERLSQATKSTVYLDEM
jgi:hypothetical protein